MRTYKIPLGFTLIEMIATVAVLAILVTVGIPSFQETIMKQRLIGAAEQLYGDLQYARADAIRRNANVFVSFTASGSNWCYGISTRTCTCGNANDCQLDNVTKMVNQDGFRNISMGVNEIEGAAPNLNFEPRRGMAKENNDSEDIDEGDITFTGTAGSVERKLRVYVRTLGSVRICSPSGQSYLSGYPECPGEDESD